MKLIAAILFLPLMLWFGSAWAYEQWNTYRHRFRLTVEVETPSGVKSGSSVVQVSVSQKADWIPQSGGVSPGVRGEAAFVDLGEIGNVVALLALGPNGSEGEIYNLAARAFGRDRPFWFKEAPFWRGRTDLRGDLMPTLVTLPDLNNPESVRPVRPDEFETVFGPGVRFRRITLEMVPAGWWPANMLGVSGVSLTSNIEQRLPQLVSLLRDQARVAGRLLYSDRPYEAHISQFVRRG